MDWLDIALKTYLFVVVFYYVYRFTRPNAGSSLIKQLRLTQISPIGKAMSEALPGYAQFQFPKSAQFGKKFAALITIQPELSADDTIIGQYGIKATSEICIKPIMRVFARSKDCYVENANNATQALSIENPTKWAIYVIPKSYPVSKVDVSISVIIDHKGNQVPYEVFERSFTINISRNFRYFWFVAKDVLTVAGAIAAIVALWK